MSLVPAIRNILLGVPELTALVGDRIMPGVFDEDVEVPAVMMYVPYGEPHDCLSGGIGMETANLRVECVSKIYQQSYEVWSIVNKALSKDFVPGLYTGCSISGIYQTDGHLVIPDRPLDGSDEWIYRTIQSFNVSYHLYEV